MTNPDLVALIGLVACYVLGAYLGYQFMSEPRPTKKQYVSAGVLGFILAYGLMLPLISAALTLYARSEDGILGISLSIAVLSTEQGIGLPLVIRRLIT